MEGLEVGIKVRQVPRKESLELVDSKVQSREIWKIAGPQPVMIHQPEVPSVLFPDC